MRPILPWNFPLGGSCASMSGRLAQGHAVQRVQIRPDAFRERPFPTSLTQCLSFSSHRPLKLTRLSTRRFEPVAKLSGVQALQSFVQGHDWVFEVLFPELQSCLFPYQNVICASWVIEFLSPVRACLHAQKSFAFFDFHSAFWLLLPCSFLCENTALPILFLQFLRKLFGRKRAICVHQRCSPFVFLNVINNFFCMLSECRLLQLSVSNHPLLPLKLLSNIHCCAMCRRASNCVRRVRVFCTPVQRALLEVSGIAQTRRN